MKNKAKFIFLAIFLLIFACEEPKESSLPPQVGGKWDLTLLEVNSQTTTYTIEVVQGGGSGSAQVKVYNDRGDNSGLSVVQNGDSVSLGSCGVEVVFSDTAGGFNLVLGDRWQVVVQGDAPGSPQPHPENQSQAKVSAQGTYTCLLANCSKGIWQSSLPLSSDLPFPTEDERELVQVSVEQSGANFSGSVLEEVVLSLNLPGLSRGDSVQVCYLCQLERGGNNSFFRARLVNGKGYQVLASRSGDNFSSSARRVCHSFSAREKELRLDFILGLQSAQDIFWMDELELVINGSTVFSDDFESGDFQNDLPAPQSRWELRFPGYQQGEAGISDIRPLSGNYSFRAFGGRRLALSGSVLEEVGREYASFLGQVQGLKISGLFFEIYENFSQGYFSSFSGAMESSRAVAGTFKGVGEGCLDEGQFVLSINPGDFYPVNQPWEMTLSGQTQNCTQKAVALIFNQFQPVQKGERFYSPSGEPVQDNYGNQYQLWGRVSGRVIYFFLGDYANPGSQKAVFYGIINTDGVNPEETDQEVVQVPNIIGQFQGWLGVEAGWSCQAQGNFQVIFPLNPVYVPVEE